jgi:catechol 2,3-dioxygenase-like lactoylglutathione lyase family enzyme
VQCFHFDSIGVPTAEVMERDHGGAAQWQAAATAEWLARLGRLPGDVRVAVLEAQTRPSFVTGAAARAAPRAAHIVLLDCSSDVRAARLRGPRQQPELATDRMDQWAVYLRGQADALDLPVIDTSLSTVAETADQLEGIIRRLIDPDAQQDGPLMKQSIVHVTLVVSDYDEAIRFYTEKLNFTVVEDTYQPQQDKRWVLIAPPGSDGTALLLGRATTSEQEQAIGNQTGGRVFLFLSTDDFWRDFHRMTALGVTFVRAPKVESYGTVAVFEDLYGNRWDLLEWSAPHSASSRAV